MSDIRAKILKLREMITERGATEAEAMAALAKADRLMAEHDLSEDDLAHAEAQRDMSSGEFKYGIKTQHPCAKWCSRTIGEFCGVITWYDKSRQTSNGFGFNGDVAMYEFLLRLIHDSMNREWKDYLAVSPKRSGVSRHTEYWSFMLGFAERINMKLQEFIDAREVKADSSGTDLIVTKQALVEQGIQELLPSLRLRSTRSRGIRADGSAMDDGRAAGNRVNLNRPIQSGPGGGRRLLS